MANRNDYLPGAVAWSAYISIFVFVYWDAAVCVWRNPIAASWAQGLGTLVAVVIAVWAHLHKLADDRRKEVADRTAQAIAVALAVYPGLIEVAARMQVIEKRLNQLSNDELDQPIGALKKGLFPAIEVAPSILRNIDKLHYVGPNLVQAIAFVETIDRMVDLAVDKQAATTPRFVKKFVDRLSLVLPRAKDEAAYFYNMPYEPDSDGH